MILYCFKFRKPTASPFPESLCKYDIQAKEARNMKNNGQTPCWKKFLFASNTGYSFVVNDHSYHSVNIVGKATGVRQTILVNWYDQMVGSLKRHVTG